MSTHGAFQCGIQIPPTPEWQAKAQGKGGKNGKDKGKNKGAGKGGKNKQWNVWSQWD